MNKNALTLSNFDFFSTSYFENVFKSPTWLLEFIYPYIYNVLSHNLLYFKCLCCSNYLCFSNLISYSQL